MNNELANELFAPASTETLQGEFVDVDNLPESDTMAVCKESCSGTCGG